MRLLNRLILHIRFELARLCASYLSRHAHKQRRLSVKERARQMCREMGKPIPEALR